jgi:hypothetical protein
MVLYVNKKQEQTLAISTHNHKISMSIHNHEVSMSNTIPPGLKKEEKTRPLNLRFSSSTIS